MNKVISIRNSKNRLTDLEFYSNVWNEYYQIIFVDNCKYITLDLFFIDFISPSVLPKLCVLACIAQKEEVYFEVNINPSSKIKKYLFDMGFFDDPYIIELFHFDYGQIGGNEDKNETLKFFRFFEKSKLIKKYLSKYTFNITPQNEKEILKLLTEAEIFGERYLPKRTLTEQMIDDSQLLKIFESVIGKKEIGAIVDLGEVYVELVVNSLLYGNGKCFLSSQLKDYHYRSTKAPFKRLDLTITDDGLGLFNSLSKKDWSKDQHTTKTIKLDNFLNLTKKEEQKKYSYLEMLYYRKDDTDRGIYQVLEYLKKKKNIVFNVVNNNSVYSFDWKNSLSDKEDFVELLNGNYIGKIKTADYPDIGFAFGIDIAFEQEDKK